MRKTMLAASLALPLLALPGMVPPATAGPPDGVSGRMVFDEVSDGLWHYHTTTSPQSRIAWLRVLAPSRDPRVALVLADLAKLRAGDHSVELRQFAIATLAEQFLPVARPLLTRPGVWSNTPQWRVGEWLLESETDLRRRAAQLPR